MAGTETRRYEFVADERQWKQVAAACWTYQFRSQGWAFGAEFVIGILLVWMGTATRDTTLTVFGVVVAMVAAVFPLVVFVGMRRSARRQFAPGRTSWTEFTDETFTLGSSRAVSTLEYGLYRYRRNWQGFVVLRSEAAPRRSLFFPAVLFPEDELWRFGKPASIQPSS